MKFYDGTEVRAVRSVCRDDTAFGLVATGEMGNRYPAKVKSRGGSVTCTVGATDRTSNCAKVEYPCQLVESAGQTITGLFADPMTDTVAAKQFANRKIQITGGRESEGAGPRGAGDGRTDQVLFQIGATTGVLDFFAALDRRSSGDANAGIVYGTWIRETQTAVTDSGGLYAAHVLSAPSPIWPRDRMQ